MEHVRMNGIYGEGDVYRVYSAEEAEREKDFCRNWPNVGDDMKRLLGMKWVDLDDPEDLDGRKEWTVIGVEDNEAWADYYWILEDGEGNRRYELANCTDFYDGII